MKKNLFPLFWKHRFYSFPCSVLTYCPRPPGRLEEAFYGVTNIFRVFIQQLSSITDAFFELSFKVFGDPFNGFLCLAQIKGPHGFVYVLS